jgi:tubulin-folding cofactor B
MQHLLLKTTGGGTVFYEILPETESDRKLGYFNLPLGANVHCIDIDPYSSSAGGAYEDTSLVEKYKMSDEEYDKRKGTLREWGRQKKEEDPDFSLKKHAREHAELVEARRLYKESGSVKNGFELDESSGLIVRVENESFVYTETTKLKSDDEIEYGPESIQHLTLHSRCQVKPGSRRGEIAFLGQIDELGGGGHWVGVILDEPTGKTDGAVNSVRYFDAPGPNRGGFFRGKNVEGGDFPEIDIFASDSEDEL